MQIEIYRPLVRSIRLVPRDKLSHAQRRNEIRPMREKVEPFFPGYAFFSFSETDEHWREVFKMVGVRGLVCANNRPVDVPWDMIREIQAREVDGAVPSETKLSEFFVFDWRTRARSVWPVRRVRRDDHGTTKGIGGR